MLLYLLIIGISVPVIELLLLLWIAQQIGFWWTVAIIFLTGAFGATLWRFQGIGVLLKLRLGIGQGQSPGDALMDGAMIFFAGGLLLTPGVVTDVVGFLFLFPWTRSIFKNRIKNYLRHRFQIMDVTSSGTFHTSSFGFREMNSESMDSEMSDDDVIDGEIVDGKVIDEHDSK